MDEKKLQKIKDRNPPVAVGEWAAVLRQAAYDAVTANDFAACFKAQVELAKAGDLPALKFLCNYLTPKDPAPLQLPTVAVNVPAVGPRAVTAEPAGDSAVAELRRRAVAMHLAIHGESELVVIARVAGVQNGELDALLDADWFSRKGRVVALSPVGRQAVA